MDSKGLQFQCEKCGAAIPYEGISLPGRTCPHCGADRPHTLKGIRCSHSYAFFGVACLWIDQPF